MVHSNFEIFVRQVERVIGQLGMVFSKSENVGWSHIFGSCQHLVVIKAIGYNLQGSGYKEEKELNQQRVQSGAVLEVEGEREEASWKPEAGSFS